MTSSLRSLRVSLLLLRLGIVIVLLAWTFDKLLRPAHGAGVLAHFYGMGGIGSTVIHAIAVLELILIALFALGLFKTWTYGLVMVMNGATTLVSFHQYLHPFQGANLLFYAAWPMLAACIALFLLRKDDLLASMGRGQPSR